MHISGGRSSIEPDAGEAAELLRAYSGAPEQKDAEFLLDRLFREYIGFWCADAARRTLGNYGIRGTDQRDEEAEIAAEVMLQMTGRLQEIRLGIAPPVTNLRAYVVTAVYNACFGRIRSRCPRHVQLQNRIRYLLANDAEFAVWTGPGGDTLAGLCGWAGRQEHVDAKVPQRSGALLKKVLRDVFGLSRGPVRLTDLMGATAESMGVAEAVFVTVEGANQASAGPSADRVLMERQELAALWGEVLQLPAPQRAALLLNLRDAGGHGVVELIPATGTATFAQLAQALTLSPEALAALWADLPFDDARIARMLEISRQQVINLRKAARERLARRQRNSGTNKPPDSASSLLKRRGRLRAFFTGETHQ